MGSGRGRCLSHPACDSQQGASPASIAGMKTQYYTATSLAGFIATTDDSLEWLFQLGDVNDTGYAEFIRDVGALAMGRTTYEWMLRHAIKLGSEAEGKWPYPQPTWVFSHRTLPVAPGADLRF